MENKITYTIRPATIDDFDFVFGIKKNALGDYIKQTWGWDEELQLKMQMEEFKKENISIIEQNGIPAGTIGINEKNDDIFISRLYIGEKDRSKGLGTKIINDIISKYHDSPKQIKFSVLHVNHRAKKLYEKLGFEVYGEENHHYKMIYKKGVICKNCGTISDSKFCPECGQKTSAGRISIKIVLHDFFHVFTHVDSGILFLIKEQFIRPGHIVKEYLEGKRKKYFSPFQFLLLGVAVSTFFAVNFDLGSGYFGDIKFSGDDAGVIRQNFIHYIYKYFNVIIFLTVPILAFYSKIFFPKAPFNYAEHLTLNTFVSAQRQVIFMLFVPLLYFFKSNSQDLMNILNLIWSVFFIWTYLQFFRQKYKFWVFLKSFLVIFIFLITNAALVGGVYFIFFR